MRKIRFHLLPEMLSQAFKGLLAVTLTTLILFFIGRRTLGEGVIALLYLVPVGWSASRWGQAAGMSAALAAALMFDFLFIPPFFTFTIATVEGVMILVIFFSVAILVVGRIQSALSRAQTSEREAIFMYELSSALSGLRTQDAAVHGDRGGIPPGGGGPLAMPVTRPDHPFAPIRSGDSAPQLNGCQSEGLDPFSSCMSRGAHPEATQPALSAMLGIQLRTFGHNRVPTLARAWIRKQQATRLQGQPHPSSR